MGTITFDYTNPSEDGTDVPTTGYLTARLLHREIVTGRFRTVDQFKIFLVDGLATAVLSDTAIDQCWRVTEQTAIAGRKTFYKQVNGDAAFTDLVDVDPTTLNPSAEPDAAWVTALAFYVKTVNGVGPDEDGDVQVAGGGGGGAVTSVAGRTGAVTLTKTDVGLSAVDNTADSAKPVSTAQATAIGVETTRALAAEATKATPSDISAAVATEVTNRNTAIGVETSRATTAEALKAPLASPALTGNPTAPTPTAGDNDTSIATTAFVTTAVAAVSGGTIADGSVTSAKIADGAIVDVDVNAAAAIAQTKIAGLAASLAAKADLAGPTFTGVPAAPTATAGTSTTQLATTAFATTADNLKAPLASPAFTGTPTGITKAHVGLGNADNTSDATVLAAAATAASSASKSADTITDGTTNKAYTATEKTKLAGVATAATANSSDATLLARANHTGTQLASTVSDFATAADARVNANLRVPIQLTQTAYNALVTAGTVVTGQAYTITGP